MSNDGRSPEQLAFVAELDDLAETLQSTLCGHEQHHGWILLSDGALSCGCGSVLYRPAADDRE